MEQLKIPKERISVLIGVKGSIKRKIQRMTKTRLIVNSEEGDIFIEGDSLDVFNCLNVVKAIARGFNPDIALKSRLLISVEKIFSLRAVMAEVIFLCHIRAVFPRNGRKFLVPCES